MAVDCGIELKKFNVTMLSLYPGAVKTEMFDSMIKTKKDSVELMINKEELNIPKSIVNIFIFKGFI